MRTTLDIDDGVLAAARAIAEAEHRSLGSVISDLARRGLVPRQRDAGAGFPTFDVSTDAAPITPDMVDRALDE
ncbi:MAG: antitoxin [Actinobacteria bacterium]|nr:antitoxin [Actinomycetota bacterium]